MCLFVYILRSRIKMNFNKNLLLFLRNTNFNFKPNAVYFNKKIFAYHSFSSIHTSPRILSENVKLEHPSLIYEGTLKKRIKRVKLLSLTSSMVGFAMLPYLVRDLSQVSILLGVGGGLISTAFLSTPFLLHWITKRYITELYFDPETKLFTAKTFNVISQEKEFQFLASDVSVPDVPGMLSSFVVRNQPLFVDDREVKDYDAYSHMMGYDKPIDFKLGSSESKEEDKSSLN